MMWEGALPAASKTSGFPGCPVSGQAKPSLKSRLHLLNVICSQAAKSAGELGCRHRERSLNVEGADLEEGDFCVDLELRTPIGRGVGNHG